MPLFKHILLSGTASSTATEVVIIEDSAAMPIYANLCNGDKVAMPMYFKAYAQDTQTIGASVQALGGEKVLGRLKINISDKVSKNTINMYFSAMRAVHMLTSGIYTRMSCVMSGELYS